jgi:hypothetical protein
MKPIYLDDAYDYSGATLSYRIRMNGKKVRDGFATAEDFPIRIFLNREAQAYIESAYPQQTGVTQDTGAYVLATLSEMIDGREGNILYQETYIDAYSPVSEGCMSEPINGHADARQRLFYTSYNEEETTLEI